MPQRSAAQVFEERPDDTAFIHTAARDASAVCSGKLGEGESLDTSDVKDRDTLLSQLSNDILTWGRVGLIDENHPLPQFRNQLLEGPLSGDIDEDDLLTAEVFWEPVVAVDGEYRSSL